MTLRLSDEQVTMLELVARTDGQTITAVIRSAIDAHIAARRGDADFRERLRAHYERERAVYERLAG